MVEQICCFVYESLIFHVLGVYSAAHDLKMEWVVVKGISRYADGTETEEKWKTCASVTAASLVFSILNDCSIFEDWPHYRGKQISFTFCFSFTVYLHAVTSWSCMRFSFVFSKCAGTELLKPSPKLN